MTETEGVIKFDLQYQTSAPEPGHALDQVLQWRDVFFRLGIIGQDPARYDGLAFGNISHRIDSGNQFIISGSQTGGMLHCTSEHFSIVDSCDVETNRVEARGPVAPSSESLTHGAIYALNERICCVVHGHAPLIWEKVRVLDLSATPRDVPYGTPQMAHAIAALYREQGQPRQALFAMLGHEDGVIAYGEEFAAIEAMFIEVTQQAALA
jgi:hypothetical protein